MNITALVLLLLGTGLDVLKQQTGGTVGEVASDASGTLKLVQVALQIHAAQTGMSMDEVLGTLKDYVPINPPPSSQTSPPGTPTS